jgi:hypothetical protein
VERPPPLLPPGLELGDARAGEGPEHSRCRLAVRRELDFAAVLPLLETLGCQLDELCAQLLGVVTRRADRRPDQRKALLSLRMKPSSVSS